MMIWDDAPLPKLPNLYCGIYIREGGASAAYEQLADELAESLDMIGAVQGAAPGQQRRLSSHARYFCAKPERCAQPVMRRSSIAIAAYMTMPSTASTTSPAKISGTWNCACACSIRLPMP